MCDDQRSRELRKAYVKWGIIVLAFGALFAISKGQFWNVIALITHFLGFMSIDEAQSAGQHFGSFIITIGVIQLVVFSTALVAFLAGLVHCAIEEKYAAMK